jgi:cold shock protein
MSSKDVSATPGEVSTSGSQYIGRVKWFNNKAGFGFVTALDGDKKDNDVFVHHSAVHVSNEQYKYLVQGEYVTFDTQKSDNSEHPYQAANVRGVYGNELMCETRWLARKKSDEDGDESKPPRRNTHPRRNTRARRNTQKKDGEWSMEKNE